jgi:hypothetical protein
MVLTGRLLLGGPPGSVGRQHGVFRESSHVGRGAFLIGLAAVASHWLGALMHVNPVSKLPCTAQGRGFDKFLNQYAAIGLDHAS